MAMSTPVRPRNHGRSGARAVANPSDPSPTAPSRSGPMQQAEASRPAISEPTRAPRSFTGRSSDLQVVAWVALELHGALVAAGHVVLVGNAHVGATRVHREHDAADGTLRELPRLRPRLGQHVAGVVPEL